MPSPRLGGANLEMPPLLDMYSRTRAAPVSQSRALVPVVDRIGSNYTPAGKQLYLDRASGIIKWKNRDTLKSTTKGAMKPLSMFKASVARSEEKISASSGASYGENGGMVDYVISPRASRAAAERGDINDEEERKETFSGETEVSGGSNEVRPTTPRRAAMDAVSRRYTLHRKSQISMLNERDLQNLRLAAEMQKEQKISIERYTYYAQNGIDDDLIAEMKTEWVRNVVRAMPSLSGLVENDNIDALVSGIVEEMQDDYVLSVKKSILDYVLKDGREQKRLGITLLPPECSAPEWGWGAGKIFALTPIEWQNSVDRAKEVMVNELFITEEPMKRLLALWDDYKHLRFVDLPASDNIAQSSKWEPQEIVAFEIYQRDHCESVKSTLMGEWYQRALSIFNDESASRPWQNMSDEKQTRFFEAVAVLMSNQVRTLVEESIKCIETFFARYERHHDIAFWAEKESVTVDGRGPPATQRGRKERRRRQSYMHKETAKKRPAFLTNMHIEESLVDPGQCEFAFQTSMQEFGEKIMRLFDTIPMLSRNIDRIEHRIPGLELETAQSLLPVGADEDFIVNSRAKVLKVLQDNLGGSDSVFTSYKKYKFVLDESNSIGEYLSQSHTLEEVQ